MMKNLSIVLMTSLLILSSIRESLSQTVNPAPFNFSLYSNCTYDPPPWDMQIYDSTSLLFSTVNSKNWGDHWTNVFWFADDIWTGTLKEYQLLLQYSFQNGTMDLHNVYSHNLTSKYGLIDLTVDDFYFNVTFFLGFCLIQDCSSQTYTTDEIKEFREDGEIIGDDEGVDYYIYSEVYAKENYKHYVHDLIKLYGADFLAFSSYRMRCLTIQDNFEGWALYIESLPDEEDDLTLILWIGIIAGGLILIGCFVYLERKYKKYWYKKNDSSDNGNVIDNENNINNDDGTTIVNV